MGTFIRHNGGEEAKEKKSNKKLKLVKHMEICYVAVL